MIIYTFYWYGSREKTTRITKIYHHSIIFFFIKAKVKKHSVSNTVRKQEVNVPHRSPEKNSSNQFPHRIILMLIKRKKSLSTLRELNGSFFAQTWIPFTQRCFVPSLVEIGPVDFSTGEENFKISSIYFRYFVTISTWKRTELFNWTNLNPRFPMMICAKFGWNWTNGSWEEVENRISLQTDGQKDRQTNRR